MTRISAARVWVAPLTSPLKSARMRLLATLPMTPPKTSRMMRVRPAEVAASRQRTGQLRGRRQRGRPRPEKRLVRGTALLLENVAGAPFGVEETRLAARLELAAQIGDEDVDRVRRRGRVVAPDLVEEALARDDQALVVHEEFEQLELPVGQLDLALAALDLAGVGIEREV